MVHDDYKEMLSARALAALDPVEDRVLSDHLSGCEECRVELEEWQNTVGALALVAKPMEPSPQVRERILAEVRREARSEESARVLPFKTAQRNVWSSIGSLGAIAAAILFIALIISVVVLWRDNRLMRQQLVLQTEQLRFQKEFGDLVNTPGSTFAKLSGTNMAPGASATLVYDKTGHAMMMTKGLPAAPAGMGYQLWFIVGTKAPMAGKVFNPSSVGEGRSVDQVPAEAQPGAVFAITLEPITGSVQPTGKIYLASQS